MEKCSRLYRDRAIALWGAAGLISCLATCAIAEERGAAQQGNMEAGAAQQEAAQQSNMEPGAPPMPFLPEQPPNVGGSHLSGGGTIIETSSGRKK